MKTGRRCFNPIMRVEPPIPPHLPQPHYANPYASPEALRLPVGERPAADGESARPGGEAQAAQSEEAIEILKHYGAYIATPPAAQEPQAEEETEEAAEEDTGGQPGTFSAES
jgi:hypothetical protein